jgi:hypothetical protein
MNQMLRSWLRLSTIRRSSEVAMFFDVTLLLWDGDAGYGKAEQLPYNLDCSRMFWDPNAFSTRSGGYDPEAPIITHFNTDRDSLNSGDGNRGNLRFHHSNNRAMNAVLVDGHAEPMRGRFDSAGRILAGGDVR